MQGLDFHLGKLTRREFREARAAGHFDAAIIATGSIEQHLEHMAFDTDIAASTRIAEIVAERLYPQVVVAVPINIGIAEHHMHSAGTLTTKPGAWLSVVFDAVDSLVRHGIKNVLILNGHGGNWPPASGVLGQWNLYFEREHEGVDLRFNSYWDVLDKEFVERVQDTPGLPGHASEFETSVAMQLIPENVRVAAVPESQDEGASAATVQKGKLLLDEIVNGVTAIVQDMLA